jgi:hypothetical protein
MSALTRDAVTANDRRQSRELAPPLIAPPNTSVSHALILTVLRTVPHRPKPYQDPASTESGI